MKQTYYFSHDYNTRQDEKIKKLIRKHGYLGYGIFWAIVEDLYNNANALQMDCEGIAYELRVECDLIKSVLNDFDLFEINDNIFHSKSVQNRLDKRNNKSISARESANKRWNNANALRNECESNAIKERKGKEKKINKINTIDDFIAFRNIEFSNYPGYFKNRLITDFKIEAPIVYTTYSINDQYKDFTQIIFDAIYDKQWIEQLGRNYDISKIKSKLTGFINYCLVSQCFRTEKYLSHYDFQKHFVNKELKSK